MRPGLELAGKVLAYGAVAALSAFLSGEFTGAQFTERLDKKSAKLATVREERTELRELLEFMASKYEADLTLCGCSLQASVDAPAPTVSEKTLNVLSPEQRTLVPEVTSK